MLVQDLSCLTVSWLIININKYIIYKPTINNLFKNIIILCITKLFDLD